MRIVSFLQQLATLIVDRRSIQKIHLKTNPYAVNRFLMHHQQLKGLPVTSAQASLDKNILNNFLQVKEQFYLIIQSIFKHIYTYMDPYSNGDMYHGHA